MVDGQWPNPGEGLGHVRAETQESRTPWDSAKPDPHDTRWMQRAQCNGQDPRDFYPSAPHGTVTKTTDDLEREVAGERCRGCPVRGECLAYALEHLIDWGVWGGTSGEQRTKMRRAASRQKRAEEKAAARGERTAT